MDLVVMEATGGYEKQAHKGLHEAGLGVAIANARSVRRFAEGLGFLEKTDKIDAGIIAEYARVKRLSPQAPASPEQEELTALVTQLRQLIDARTALKNQMRLIESEAVQQSQGRLLDAFNREIKQIDVLVQAHMKQQTLWIRLVEGLGAIAGVAERTMAYLLAYLPELGTLNAKAIAKLVGLAPIAKDSGKSQGRRMVRGGRVQIRSILVFITSVVARYEPKFREFRQKLLDAGKPKMVVRTAVARKLLVIMNAKARDIIAELNLAA
ncbi:hypothetical protein ABAC460_09090 [Asticcacaulis sp. AC460]|nr:hypothetical protein ABAC460_09090 [Asticcacaulis sp. AC460]